MRFLGVYNSGDASDSIIRVPRHTSHRLQIPHQTKNVKYITGSVRNMSGTGRVNVMLYVSGRESKQVILAPYERMQLKNHPCDVMTVMGVANAGCLVDYHLVAYETESVDETAIVLANSEVFVELMSQADILAQRVVHSLTSINGLGGFNIDVPYGRQAVMRDVHVEFNPVDLMQAGIADNAVVRLQMAIETTALPATPVIALLGTKTRYTDTRRGDWATPVYWEGDGEQARLAFRTSYVNIPPAVVVHSLVEVSYGLV